MSKTFCRKSFGKRLKKDLKKLSKLGYTGKSHPQHPPFFYPTTTPHPSYFDFVESKTYKNMVFVSLLKKNVCKHFFLTFKTIDFYCFFWHFFHTNTFKNIVFANTLSRLSNYNFYSLYSAPKARKSFALN